MTALRNRLKDRRPHWHTGLSVTARATPGFDDGRIAEIFINGSKAGTAAETNAQDAAIIASLALQHGCPIETLRHALTRTGSPGGPLATLLALEDAREL